MKHSNSLKEKDEHSHGWGEETAMNYADKYGEHPINSMTAKRANLVAGDRVLDIGCGTGSALRSAASLAFPLELYGIDPTSFMVNRAQELSANLKEEKVITFRQACAEMIPLSDDQVTLCWAINSMHHWSDIAEGLKEVKRVLVEAGRLLIVEEIFEQDFGMTLDEIDIHLKNAGFEISKKEIWHTPDSDMNVITASNKKGE